MGEFRTIDPAQINQVLLFQISSNVLSALTHINPHLVAEGDPQKSIHSAVIENIKDIEKLGDHLVKIVLVEPC